MALVNKLTAIGDAIRNKNGSTSKLTLDGMVTAIESINLGLEYEVGSFKASTSSSDKKVVYFSNTHDKTPAICCAFTKKSISANYRMYGSVFVNYESFGRNIPPYGMSSCCYYSNEQYLTYGYGISYNTSGNSFMYLPYCATNEYYRIFNDNYQYISGYTYYWIAIWI